MKLLGRNKTVRCFVHALLGLLILVTTGFPDGLPGEYLVSSRWRDLLWWHSPLSNPAFMTKEDYTTFRAAFAPTMQGEFKLWETGLTLPVGMTQSAGISVLGEDDGVVNGSTIDDATGQIVTTNQTSTNDNLFIMGSYAIRLWDKLSVGANLNTAYQSNFGDHLIGVGFDLGCSYEVLNTPVLGDHTIGISTVNLVAPSMGRSLVSPSDNTEAYSRDLRLSWMGDFWEKKLQSGLDFDLKDFWANAKEFESTGDVSKIAQQMEWDAEWRLGTWIMHTLGLYLQLGFDNKFLEYWGFAGGVRVPWSGKGPEVSMFYQYNIKTEGDLASVHTFYIIMNLGKKREEVPKKYEQLSTMYNPPKKSSVRDLEKIKGLRVEEEKEFIRITATEIAIHFASGSSEVPSDAIDALKEIAKFLRNYPEHPVSIEGHTDNDPITGKLKALYHDNTALSLARCEKVKQYFVNEEKLPEKLFTTKGYGETMPIAPNTTSESKYKNRRVVVIVKK